MPLERIFDHGAPTRGTNRPGADYHTQLSLAKHPGNTATDVTDKLAGGGLTSPEGFTPPPCPRCGGALDVKWHQSRGYRRHLVCGGCGLVIRLRRLGTRYHNAANGYFPDWPADLSGLTVAQRERFMRNFRAAVALQLRTQRRVGNSPVELAAEIPADLRLARALAMFPQWFLRAGRAYQLMRRSDGKVVLKAVSGARQGGPAVPCPACGDFRSGDPLARCPICCGFREVPSALAEWYEEMRRAAAAPELEHVA